MLVFAPGYWCDVAVPGLRVPVQAKHQQSCSDPLSQKYATVRTRMFVNGRSRISQFLADSAKKKIKRKPFLRNQNYLIDSMGIILTCALVSAVPKDIKPCRNSVSRAKYPYVKKPRSRNVLSIKTAKWKCRHARKLAKTVQKNHGDPSYHMGMQHRMIKTSLIHPSISAGCIKKNLN